MTASEMVNAPASAQVQHETRAQHRARGKRARMQVPRASLADLHLREDRPDPIALLEEQAVSRVPELVPVRYGRMAVSPFTFFRGAALVMATDLSSSPVTGIKVQACGDAHLSNFGAFGSPERDLVFDINDFDETLPGPWEWDVKRLAASLEIAGRDNGLAAADRRIVVETAGRAYRESMRSFAEQSVKDVWYARLDAANVTAAADRVGKAQRKRLEANIAKARTRDSLQAFTKLTEVVDGQRRIVSSPPLIVAARDLVSDLQDAERVVETIRTAYRSYRSTLTSDRKYLLEQYQFIDLARKVVGVGSVGSRCWIALLVDTDGDPLFLQIKEAQQSVLSRFHGAGKFRNQGARVVAGQRLMQSASDIFLGWQQLVGVDGVTRDYYWRQLRDWKLSAAIELMTAPALTEYARMCAWVLAKAHARSGDRIAIATYLGAGTAFDVAIADFARDYADLNERDHQALLDAIKSGRVAAEHGV